jgi:hypothetical protein
MTEKGEVNPTYDGRPNFAVNFSDQRTQGLSESKRVGEDRSIKGKLCERDRKKSPHHLFRVRLPISSM